MAPWGGGSLAAKMPIKMSAFHITILGLHHRLQLPASADLGRQQ